MSNSLKLQRSIMKSFQEQYRHTSAQENDLRLKLNKLLSERQINLTLIDKYRVREWDLMRQVELANKAKASAKASQESALDKVEQFKELLERQIKLKEMFEDKLRDTLNMRIDAINGKPVAGEQTEEDEQAKRDAQSLRKKQTKMVLLGFSVELKSVEIEYEDQLDKKEAKAFDSFYQENQVH